MSNYNILLVISHKLFDFLIMHESKNIDETCFIIMIAVIMCPVLNEKVHINKYNNCECNKLKLHIMCWCKMQQLSNGC